MTRYFNIDRYKRQKYGLISMHILLFDTNTTRDHNVYASFRPSIVTKDVETRGKMNSVMVSET